MAFREDWLRRIGVSPKLARLLVALDDSKRETINDSDVMIVYISIREFIDEAISALAYGRLVPLKRQQFAAFRTIAAQERQSTLPDGGSANGRAARAYHRWRRPLGRWRDMREIVYPIALAVAAWWLLSTTALAEAPVDMNRCMQLLQDMHRYETFNGDQARQSLNNTKLGLQLCVLSGHIPWDLVESFISSFGPTPDHVDKEIGRQAVCTTCSHFGAKIKVIA